MNNGYTMIQNLMIKKLAEKERKAGAKNVEATAESVLQNITALKQIGTSFGLDFEYLPVQDKRMLSKVIFPTGGTIFKILDSKSDANGLEMIEVAAMFYAEQGNTIPAGTGTYRAHRSEVFKGDEVSDAMRSDKLRATAMGHAEAKALHMALSVHLTGEDLAELALEKNLGDDPTIHAQAVERAKKHPVTEEVKPSKVKREKPSSGSGSKKKAVTPETTAEIDIPVPSDEPSDAPVQYENIGGIMIPVPPTASEVQDKKTEMKEIPEEKAVTPKTTPEPSSQDQKQDDSEAEAETEILTEDEVLPEDEDIPVVVDDEETSSDEMTPELAIARDAVANYGESLEGKTLGELYDGGTESRSWLCWLYTKNKKDGNEEMCEKLKLVISQDPSLLKKTHI